MLLMLEIHVDRVYISAHCVYEGVNTKAFVITYKESVSFENATQCVRNSSFTSNMCEY